LPLVERADVVVVGPGRLGAGRDLALVRAPDVLAVDQIVQLAQLVGRQDVLDDQVAHQVEQVALGLVHPRCPPPAAAFYARGRKAQTSIAEPRSTCGGVRWPGGWAPYGRRRSSTSPRAMLRTSVLGWSTAGEPGLEAAV